MKRQGYSTKLMLMAMMACTFWVLTSPLAAAAEIATEDQYDEEPSWTVPENSDPDKNYPVGEFDETGSGEQSLPSSSTNGGANDPDLTTFDPTGTGSTMPGAGGGGAVGMPDAGTVGNADAKDPLGQSLNDQNKGFECDGNPGVGDGNPAHTACANEGDTDDGDGNGNGNGGPPPADVVPAPGNDGNNNGNPCEDRADENASDNASGNGEAGNDDATNGNGNGPPFCEETTMEETTTPPDETTMEETTTPPDETTMEETTTPPDETTMEETTTPPDETTMEETTTPPDETTMEETTTPPDETTMEETTTPPDETTMEETTTPPDETTMEETTTPPDETTMEETTTPPDETTMEETTTPPDETTPPEVNPTDNGDQPTEDGDGGQPEVAITEADDDATANEEAVAGTSESGEEDSGEGQDVLASGATADIQSSDSDQEESGLAVLPDTGGPVLFLPILAALLLGLGSLGAVISRRRLLADREEE